MIIKSKFKDYYDHIAHIYGGGDPKVVYDRKPFVNPTAGSVVSYFLHDTKAKLSVVPRYFDKMDFSISFLVVAGQEYVLVTNKKLETSVLNKNRHPEVFQYFSRYSRGFYANQRATNSDLITLSRELNSPVFIYHNLGYDFRVRKHAHVYVEKNIPRLSEIGFASIVPPEQVYQDIAYFLGNVIHESPDTAPPVEVSNKDKILQAGFDLKTSFRHPVK